MTDLNLILNRMSQLKTDPSAGRLEGVAAALLAGVLGVVVLASLL